MDVRRVPAPVKAVVHLGSRSYGRKVALSVQLSTAMLGSSSSDGIRQGSAPVARNASDRYATGVTYFSASRHASMA